ncbi:MAG: cupin, partial [Ilumatobacteraceae bacterium]
GDVVLQPPTIRHRVLETSPGFEIVEVGAPADHLTTLDHGLALPNGTGDADREWAGQRFVHYRAGSGAPVAFDAPGFSALDTGIGAATNGVVEVRMVSAGDGAFADPVEAEFRFMFVMDGSVSVTFADGTGRRLSGGDSLAAPAVAGAVLADPSTDCVLLDVVVPR